MGNGKTKELSSTEREDIVAAIEEKASNEAPVIASFLNGAPPPATIEEILEKGLSQQMQQNVTNFNALFGESKIIQPPYDPFKLALLLEQNTRLNRACQIRARNTVGLGWEIASRPYDKTLDEPPEEESLRKERDMLAPLFTNPNDKIPFTEVAYREKLDEEATGSGYVEITRDGTGKIDGIYHIPAHTMRVRQGDLGFVQIRGTSKAFFKPFGEKRVMNKGNGKYETTTASNRATEIIPFTLYSPRSSYYGIPRWISSVAAIQGSRLAAIRNIAFFENDAVGRLAIVVSGGQLSDKSVAGIQDFLRADAKGPEKAHRVMVLQAEPRKVLGSRGPGTGTKIEVVPLTVGITEDGSFLGYRKANDEEVRESSGLSSPYFTSEGINRATASVLRKIAIEQELIPDLKSHEWTWNSTVVQSFGVKDVMLQFVRPKVLDTLEEATVHGILQKAGVASINESRKALGLPPFPDELIFGQLPLPFAMLFLDMGLSAQGMVTPKGPQAWEPPEAEDTGTMPDADDEDASDNDDNDDGNDDGNEKIRTPTGHRVSKDARGIVKALTGVAMSAKEFLKTELGRDVLDAEVVLQHPDGTIIDRVPLNDVVTRK
jgi:PBSX family phage portal protein